MLLRAHLGVIIGGPKSPPWVFDKQQIKRVLNENLEKHTGGAFPSKWNLFERTKESLETFNENFKMPISSEISKKSKITSN